MGWLGKHFGGHCSIIAACGRTVKKSGPTCRARNPSVAPASALRSRSRLGGTPGVAPASQTKEKIHG